MTSFWGGWGIMDWDLKVRDLKRIINELEMLSHHLEGRHRMLLARSADELKQFTGDIERLLQADQQGEEPQTQNLPEWLNTGEDDFYGDA
jgi:hypothetical protein